MRIAVLVVALMPAGQPPAALERLANDAWTSARAAAAQGGSPESLQSAQRLVAEIDALTGATSWRLHGEYAHALIRAAMAAAQNENAEMDLQLSHARGLFERLQTSTSPAKWPREIDEAEGELYLEVARYLDAARAFRRAANVAAACDAYRRVASATPLAARDEATEFLKRCP
jgi:hypothetical protein